MDISRLRNLINEYKEAYSKLAEVRGQYDKTKISYELAIDLEKELLDEIRMAKEANKGELVEYWESVKKDCFSSDKDLASKENFEKAEKDILLKNEKIISYYEKKIKVIRKHLGARLTQLLENYEERNVLMGEGYSSKRFAHALYEDDEKEMDKLENEKKTRATFDKM